jgi:hypothetical protein
MPAPRRAPQDRTAPTSASQSDALASRRGLRRDATGGWILYGAEEDARLRLAPRHAACRRRLDQAFRQVCRSSAEVLLLRRL